MLRTIKTCECITIILSNKKCVCMGGKYLTNENNTLFLTRAIDKIRYRCFTLVNNIEKAIVINNR